MTAKDQLKILDKKIKQNIADYDLYRQNAEIFALDKYEYLTGKDLQYKPDPVDQDLINEINDCRKRSIGFKNERLVRLEREIKNKEREIRDKERENRYKRRENKDNNKSKKEYSIFNHIATDGTPFYFSEDV